MAFNAAVQFSIVAVPVALPVLASVLPAVLEVQAARQALLVAVLCTPRGVRPRALHKVRVQEWVHVPALLLVLASASGPAWEQAVPAA